ncbi:MAG: ATP-binding protein, partial [Calditrichaeota bacterium]|nr:ATP-binding protein [Calditrichota bacterium]
MKHIKILPPQIANKIAAGEVVDRPAAVVKELIENSIDAEATEITVVLEQSGKNMIQVVDNGTGISADDVPLAFQR